MITKEITEHETAGMFWGMPPITFRSDIERSSREHERSTTKVRFDKLISSVRADGVSRLYLVLVKNEF
jgi:hypothetical protein